MRWSSEKFGGYGVVEGVVGTGVEDIIRDVQGVV